MITVNVKNAVGLLNAVQKSISSPEIIVWAKTKADPYMRSQFAEQFKSEGKRYGNGWIGIKESSLESRNKGLGQKKYRKSKTGTGRIGGALVSEGRVTGVNILHDTGTLFNQVVNTKGDVIVSGEGIKISWGNNLKEISGRINLYRVHQLGTLGKSKPNPPRPMISGDTKDMKHLLLSLYGYIGSRIRFHR